ncbi:hypothetical protein BDA99DRAFT_562974 [Phascolomyces articulosus]|uniref:Uncharacterized protein n=1 Tax=Phascolomyces articulosus TaxID=60185 RepID=A0AAD5JT51_9FUNG|nr:hypothetical protein BDA99DRAFT_562974 [Phascolomyces articulosus]
MTGKKINTKTIGFIGTDGVNSRFAPVGTVDQLQTTVDIVLSRVPIRKLENIPVNHLWRLHPMDLFHIENGIHVPNGPRQPQLLVIMWMSKNTPVYLTPSVGTMPEGLSKEETMY